MAQKSLWQNITENIKHTQKLPQKKKKRLVWSLGSVATIVIVIILLPTMIADYRSAFTENDDETENFSEIRQETKELATTISTAKESIEEAQEANKHFKLQQEYQAWNEMNAETNEIERKFLPREDASRTAHVTVDRKGFIIPKNLE